MAASKKQPKPRHPCKFRTGPIAVSTALIWLAVGGGMAPLSSRAQPPSPVDVPDTVTSPLGESPEPKSETKQADPEGGVLEEVGPRIYYIPDDQGNLRAALLNEMTFEEFKKLLGQLAVRQEAPPQYTLRSLAMTGSAQLERVKVSIELTILNRHESDQAWVRIPLKMAGMILPLDDSVVYQGPGKFFLHYDDQAPGYVAWLRGGVGEQHQLRLTAFVPIQQLGSERRMRLNIPRATKSDFQLTIPSDGITATVASGGHLRAPESSDGRTNVIVDGVAGDLRVAWRPARERNARRIQALDVEGRQLVQVEGGQVRSEVDLTIQSFVGPFDHFRVQLPPAARLVSEGQAGYTLVVSEAMEEADAKAGGQQWIDIKLEKPTKGPIDIHLVVQQLRDSNRPDHQLQLAGFRVEDAIRQSGEIAVQVNGDWRIKWLENFEKRFDIRRVDVLAELATNPDVVARFEYYRQPYSLKVLIEPPTSEISVEPEYVLDVSDNSVILDARLRYQVRGASIFDSVAIDMPGWEVLPGAVGPIELVKVEDLSVDPLGRLEVPLLRSVKGEFEIIIRARRTLDPEAARIHMPMPKPVAENVGETTVILGAADNVELTPDNTSDLQTGLPPAIANQLGPRQQKPLYYLFQRGDEVPTDLSAEFQIHPLMVSAAVYSNVNLTRRTITIMQSLIFDIEYRRVESVSLRIPRELVSRDGLVMRDGEPLALSIVEDEQPEPYVEARVPLDNDIGRVQLDVQYVLVPDRFTSASRATLKVPLVMPVQDALSDNYLILAGDRDIEVDPVGEQWISIAATDLRLLGAKRADWSDGDFYQCEEPSEQLTLSAGITERPSSGALLVKRAWIQTWLTSLVRYDQMVFRFESREELFGFQLPKQVDGTTVEVRLDGRPIKSKMSRDNLMQIELGSAETERTLELRYSTPRSAGGWGRLQLAMPEFPAGLELRQPLYWQLVLPLREHLFNGPANSSPWYDWQWQRLGWHRVPLNSEVELARWSGLTAGPDGYSSLVNAASQGGVNVYLFRMPELPTQVAVETLPRTMLVMLPAGLVLIAGTLMIYLRTLRRAEVVFVVTIGILALGFIYPEPAMIMAQMAILGVVLALLGVFLRRMLDTQRPKQLIIQRDAGGSSARHATTQRYEPPAAGIGGSTVTGPPTLEGPILDSSATEPQP